MIFLVLNSGYISEPQHVEARPRQLLRDAIGSVPAAIVCLSDKPLDIPHVTTHRLVYDLPRQWSQIEILRPELYPDQDIWYFDLDTKIISSIDDILKQNITDALLDDFLTPGLLRSDVMRITAETRAYLWDRFVERGRYFFTMKDPKSDGVLSVSKGFWNYYFPQRVPLQQFFPDRFVSFKKHCRMDDGVIIAPKKASVLCFHGLPKYKPMDADVVRKK